MTVDTAKFRMADRLAGGTLAVQIAAYRARGVSYDRIAALLYAEHHIEVSGPTIKTWVDELGSPTEAA